MKFAALLIVAVPVGIAAGIGSYTFIYAKGASYLTNNPAACANCHIMQDYYDAWLKASHRSAAVCNDCHTPKGLIPKYMTKASNGFWHSFGFTTGRFPEPLQIKPHNREIAEKRCRSCHAEIVAAIEAAADRERASALACIKCHAHAGHMR